MATETSDMNEIKAWLMKIDSRLDKLDDFGVAIETLQVRSAEHDEKLQDLTTRMLDVDAKSSNTVGKLDELSSTLEASCATIKQLESKLEIVSGKLHEYEQYSKRDNLIITGLRLVQPFSTVVKQPNTMPNDAVNGNAAQHQAISEETTAWSPRERTIMAGNFVNFAKEKLGVHMQTSDIIDIHVLPNTARKTAFSDQRKSTTSTRTIVRFSNRRVRDEVYASRTMLKRGNTNIYINEHLTPANSELFKKTRECKTAKKILNTWTNNGKVMVKLLNGSNKVVNNIQQLVHLSK